MNVQDASCKAGKSDKVEGQKALVWVVRDGNSQRDCVVPVVGDVLNQAEFAAEEPGLT